MGMNRHHLQIIDLITMRSQIITKGVVKQYFQMNSKEASIAIFSDGSAIVIDKEIEEYHIGNGDFVFCDMLGIGILCDNKGKISFCDKHAKSINFSMKHAQQIGCNADCNQIFIAEKGKIHIIE